MSAPAPPRNRWSSASSANVKIPRRHALPVLAFHNGRCRDPIPAEGQAAARAAVDALLCQRCGQSRVSPVVCRCERGAS